METAIADSVTWSSVMHAILHVDQSLVMLLNTVGGWIYVVLFLIIFCETGLVIFPFLPGDSLLFVLGAFAARGDLNLSVLIVTLIIAAISGDALNYTIGRTAGGKLMQSRWFNQSAYDKAQAFYDKHGGKTIVMARFIPLIRTFAPFVAGVSRMDYRRFALFNVAGGLIWIVSLLLAGWFFGNIEWVQANLTKVIYGIVVLSIAPIVLEAIRVNWLNKN
jgi:membrane-associated protein